MAALFVIHAETDSSSAQILDNGQCGPTAYYHYDSDGTLEIYGAGVVYDYCYTDAPWNTYSYRVTKIIIGDQITHLGECALAGCTHAKELTIPITLNAVSSDMAHAFAGDYNFEKITFTCGTSGCGFDYAAYDGNNAWYQNTPWYLSRACLKEIVFEDGITHIGSDAFRELNITKVALPESVTSLGCHCFFNCTKLTDLTIPVSLNSYGNETYPAFDGCLAVENVNITRGNGVAFDYSNWCRSEKLSYLAPWNMNSSITKCVNIADNVTSLGNFMFLNCNVRELTLPINLSADGDRHAFMGAYDSLEKVTFTKGTGRGPDCDSFNRQYYPWDMAQNLKTIIVEEGVTHIGNYEFDLCRANTVVLPDTLCSFGKCSFYCCHIEDLTLPISANTVWLDDTPAFYHISALHKITFAPGSGNGFNYAAYKGNNCWYQLTPWYSSMDTLEEIVFKDGIKSIGSDAFREITITSIVIPDSVESLGNHTFFNCENLTDLTIPITLDSVYSSKYPAFEGCLSITNLRFTAGADGVGFDYTDTLPIWCNPFHKASEIRFDSGITYIGTCTLNGYVFSGADGRYMESVASNLSGHAFCGVDGLMDMIDNQGLDPAVQSVPAVRCGPVPAGRV